MINTPELLRTLRPMVTPEAALRMHREQMARAMAAAITWPLDIAACFWMTWAEVYSPSGEKKADAVKLVLVQRSAG